MENREGPWNPIDPYSPSFAESQTGARGRKGRPSIGIGQAKGPWQDIADTASEPSFHAKAQANNDSLSLRSFGTALTFPRVRSALDLVERKAVRRAGSLEPGKLQPNAPRGIEAELA